jgi:hypothetical protein
MFQYEVRAVETHRQAARGDRVGIIVFGPLESEDLRSERWLGQETGHGACGPRAPNVGRVRLAFGARKPQSGELAPAIGRSDFF